MKCCWLTRSYCGTERAEHKKHYVEEEKIEVVEYVDSILADFEVDHTNDYGNYEMHREPCEC